MQLPNRENAYIPMSKLSGYLLSTTHAVGRAKAQFFRGVGFDETHVRELEQGLLAMAHSQEISEAIASPHGTKYVIEGWLQTPRGNVVQIRTVWIIDIGQDYPRFVTAYPL